MNKHHTILFAWLFCTAFPATSFAREVDMTNILANLGNVGIDGQPNLSFDIVDNPDAAELKRLGFSFKLSHQVCLAHGVQARTGWWMPALKTAVYLDGQGNLAWLRPDGRTVRYQKADGGFDKGNDGSTVMVSSDGNDVEIFTARGARWLFKRGFANFVQSGENAYDFKTDRETILAIVKVAGASCSQNIREQDAPATLPGKPLLEIKYSNTGQLAELIFSHGQKYTFQWTPDGCLQSAYNDTGRHFDFEYDNGLLKSYHTDDVTLRQFKWAPFESALRRVLGRPPVMLGEDSSFQYHWERKESLIILNIFRKSGGWISRTCFSSKGVTQQTPHETLRHDFK